MQKDSKNGEKYNICESIGVSRKVNPFLRKTIKAGVLPCGVRLNDSYNQVTIDALNEAERLMHDPTAKRYNVEEALKELKR